MKVTYNWLKDFVAITLSPDAVANKLTMAGIEVKSVEARDGDYVFEIEITSNRPDWLSVIGIAREVAAITGAKLKVAHFRAGARPKGKTSKEKFVIGIEDKKDCPLYTAKVIRNVRVGQSPEWLRKRLELVGCRSVNNVVDITNYVLFETGEPLHAFDLDRLSPNEIIIRRAKPGEEIVSIDGAAHKLDRDILVIADNRRPVAIAGVMGGKETEVSAKTTNVLLEAAIFNPVVVRRGRQRLGMQSEAAYRFERGVDQETAEAASARTVALILDICGGELVCQKSSPAPRKAKAPVSISAASIQRYLGIEISAQAVKVILERLGFRVSAKGKNVFSVSVPGWRQDVGLEIDLVEEIARIHGFEKIPSTLPSVLLKNQKQEQEYIPFIKDILKGLGLCETVTYSLIDRAGLAGFWDDEQSLIAIANPLSQEQEVMRPVLMPGLARCVAYNLRQKQGHVALFEVAKVYCRADSRIKEQYNAAIALCGSKIRWMEKDGAHFSDEEGWLHLKGIVDSLLGRLGINLTQRSYSRLDSGAIGLDVGDKRIGVLKKLSRQILESLEVKNRQIFQAELSVEPMLERADTVKKFRAFPRFPGMARDISLVVKDGVSIEAITAAIIQEAGALAQEVAMTDYYRGHPIEAGSKNLTISCLYCSAERTLTDAEITPLHDRIKKALQEKFSAQIR